MKKPEEAIPTAIYDTENADHELQAQYGLPEVEYKPAFLYVERGPGAGQLLEVKQGTVVIGRASVSDLRIQHPSISRRHAQIKRVGEQYFVKDLGSQNGTFVNKQRIATEVEAKIGDTLAVGNALVKLRGPVVKGEKLGTPVAPAPRVESTKSRQATAVLPRIQPHAAPAPRNNALILAVFAAAVGLGLAAALGVALLKMSSTPVATAPEKRDSVAAATPSEKDALIAAALSKKMQERGAAAAAAAAQPEVAVQDSPPVVARTEQKVAAPAVVVPMPGSAAPSRAAAAPPSVTRVAAAAPAPKAAAKAKSDDDDEEGDSAPKGGNAKRTQILAPYEKGNAEGALELAKKAGDKDLVEKLTKFIQAYDTANDAMLSNNGTVAITNFQKALQIDEGLSSGWGKYGGEIRKQLSSLYTLVGIQFAQGGEEEKAKKAFEAALKHDPSNGRAKSNLEKLGGSAGAADDEAAAPAKRAPVKAAKKPQSIDDAFGD